MPNLRSNDNRERESSVPAWVHLVVLAVIALVIIFVVVKLSIWNKGREVDTSDVNAEDFEVEVLDQIFVLPAEKKEGHEDDGEETILVLGNDAVTYDYSKTGFCGLVADKTGATVINAGFPKSTISVKNAEYQADYPMDSFSFNNIVDSIVTGDFSRMDEALNSFTEDNTYTLSLGSLENTDFSKVDTLVIYYDALDYISLRPGMNPGDEVDPMTYMGALRSGIKKIQEKYPYIRVVCMSFTFCYAYDTDGSLKNGDRVDFGNGKLTTYLQHMIDVCGDTGVSFVDNYYGTIDEGNSSEYMLDNIHVNQACNEHIAAHFAEVIYGK